MAGSSGTTMGTMSTTSMGMGGAGSTGTGMMEMKPVAKIDVPKGKTVSLAPGGYRIMLLDLKQPLARGPEVHARAHLREGGQGRRAGGG